jgi:hypothetical protein
MTIQNRSVQVYEGDGKDNGARRITLLCKSFDITQAKAGNVFTAQLTEVFEAAVKELRELMEFVKMSPCNLQINHTPFGFGRIMAIYNRVPTESWWIDWSGQFGPADLVNYEGSYRFR